MTIDLTALGDFMAYEKVKYISPAKASERAEEMEDFKKAGQVARKTFQGLVTALLGRTENFQADKVSAWMNQAQVGRPHFWCYFFVEGDTRLDPTFAIRLKTIDGVLGISCELSFIERGSQPDTLLRQNQVLKVDVTDDSLYYWAQVKGESNYFPLTLASRKVLAKGLASGEVRKVLVKYDIPAIESFGSAQALVEELLAGFEKLLPFYEATRQLKQD